MKIYRSILVVLLVVATWFAFSLSKPASMAMDNRLYNPDAPQIQKSKEKLASLQIQILELQPLIENRNWDEVQSFIRGPLGDFEIRLNSLKNSSVLSSNRKVDININRVSRSLSKLYSSARVGNYQQSVDSFQAFIDEFDDLLSLAGISDLSSLQESSPIELQVRGNSGNGSDRGLKTEKSFELSRSGKNDFQSDNQSDNKPRKYTLENKGQDNMDEAFSPDLTYLALVCLIPLMIYLQIRHQHSNQEYQTKVSELEGKIESLNQDKAELGSALEETQGQLVGMFMNLEETKPVARLTQKHVVTVEEQEERIKANAPFVMALLEQADQTSFEDDKT